MSEWVLARALPAPAAILGPLVRRVSSDGAPAAWAEIIERLQRLSGVEFDLAVRDLDVAGLSPYASNYLAALVEMTAMRLDCRPPRWTRNVEPLVLPRFGTRLRRLKEHLLTHAPVAFRRRNIFVNAAIGDRV